MKGVHYKINPNNKGVLTVLTKDGIKNIMLLADYKAMKNSPLSKHCFYKELCNETPSKFVTIKNRTRFNIWVCLEGKTPLEIGDENGIIQVLIGGVWRKAQFADQYQKQHGLASKQSVFYKARSGQHALSMGTFYRYNEKQHINLIILS